MYILWVLSSPPFPFSVGGLKRDLLHSSFGTKYAPWQTPRLALERNPMHFIRGQVIQSDGSLLIPGVYSGTPPPPRTSSPVAPLWTQSNPRGPSQPSTETSGPLLPSSCLTCPLSLHRLTGLRAVCVARSWKRGRGREGRVCLRVVSGVQCPYNVPQGFCRRSQGSYASSSDRYRGITDAFMVHSGREGEGVNPCGVMLSFAGKIAGEREEV